VFSEAWKCALQTIHRLHQRQTKHRVANLADCVCRLWSPSRHQRRGGLPFGPIRTVQIVNNSSDEQAPADHYSAGDQKCGHGIVLRELDSVSSQIASLGALVATISRVGFNSAVVMREHFRREIGLAPVDYRRRFVFPSSSRPDVDDELELTA